MFWKIQFLLIDLNLLQDNFHVHQEMCSKTVDKISFESDIKNFSLSSSNQGSFSKFFLLLMLYLYTSYNFLFSSRKEFNI